MENKIMEQIGSHQKIIDAIKGDVSIISELEEIISLIVKTFKSGNKVLICGNGGSAADAQHIATELSGRFYLNRAPLNAEALHVNSSFVTAVANDLGYEHIFSRALQAKASKNDILLSLSTSAHSLNVINAMRSAQDIGVINIAMTGQNPKEMASLSQHIISIPSEDTPRIQEMHLLLAHIICQQVEALLFAS